MMMARQAVCIVLDVLIAWVPWRSWMGVEANTSTEGADLSPFNVMSLGRCSGSLLNDFARRQKK
ncbi:hypothetical protein-transmembrane prediction [Rhodopirellula baltica SH 1]|uniref:Uncharacterized protein n=1 Tax=Rhodopirellula baltica (strain DSM 10527 / NCIMB 13988 / SH1) TaxID=243090 RepID=Q7UTW1_RHOBA|nr:hypothetical protein-transmembrane prediction [Rhodopirellula baltica SH 1]